MSSVRRTFQVLNRLGLHMRAAALLVQTASKFDADVTVSKDDQAVNGKSIIGLMMLAAPQGSQIEVEATGAQAEEAVAAIGALFDRKFDEE
ncbi:MAG TPA: HPr family phosphocarrier protein [Candidatus Kryptonia bacterium]|nr:HPr family phosphocarrier protein [Candidatus Kryptonia bacterium]